MTEASVAGDTRILQGIERELDRLRAARPHLDSRIGRAESIIVTQLSVRGEHRPVRVKVRADGSRSYKVRSGSKLRREYDVDPLAWTCSCPDHVKRGAACKHSITCWVMDRVIMVGVH